MARDSSRWLEMAHLEACPRQVQGCLRADGVLTVEPWYEIVAELEAATLSNGGCNRMSYAVEAVTLCDGGSNPT